MKKIKYFVLLVLVSLQIDAQSLREKIIYVSQSQPVMLKFRSTINNIDFSNRDSAKYFETTPTSKSYSINAKVQNFRSTNLTISEGGNTHLFILQYKETLDPNTESLYDFSSKEKLKKAAETILPTSNEPPQKEPVDPVINQPPVTNTDTRPVTPIPAEVKPTQKEITPSYTDIVAKADMAFDKETLDEAEKLYAAALAIKPKDTWCEYRIAAITNKRNISKIKDQERISELAYQKHIKIADSARDRKSYDLARDEYNQAIRERLNDPYALAQIKKIAQAVKDDSYERHIIIGKDALTNGLFDKADMEFREALKLKPNDAEAKKELGKIGPAMAELIKKQNKERMLQNEEQMRLKKQNQYNDSVSLADNMFDAGLYEEAKKKYSKASVLKPGDIHVKNRMKEIEEIFLKRKIELNKIKTDSLNAVAYKKEIDKGNNAFYNRDYTRAKSAFQMAQRLSPSEKFPAERISAIDVILLQIAEEKKAAQAMKASEERKNKEYNIAVRQGNAAMVNSKFEAAKDFFLQAKELKPGEKYPVSQLGIIYSKLAEIRENERYDNFIHIADSLAFTDKEGKSSSLRWYDSARILKPLSSYPTKQIIYINQELFKNEVAVSKQKRSQKFQNAIPDYNRAESLALDLKYTEAYAAYSEFLSKIDTLNLNDYMPSELYRIERAKEMLGRIEGSPRKPKLKEESLIIPPAPAPVELDNKKKKKKTKKDGTEGSPAANINTEYPGNTVFTMTGYNWNAFRAWQANEIKRTLVRGWDS